MDPPRPYSLPALLHLLAIRPLVKLAFGASAEGREHLDDQEQFILVANHNSHLDVVLLFQVLPWRLLRRTHPVAAWDYFSRSRILRALAQYFLQPVWIVRGQKETDPLEGMRGRLRDGHSLIIFPEGTRGEAGRIARFKTGVARLALEFPDVPVIPAFLSGPERALPRSRIFPTLLWNRVVVGPPLHPRGSVEGITNTLEGLVRKMADAEAETRHRRRRRPESVPSIAVLGIDGSGKSTLSRRLAKRLSATGRSCLVTDDVAFFEDGEPREMHVLLKERVREAIGHRAKRAGSLKSYKIPKLAELLLRDRIVADIRRWYAPDVIVTDGSPLLNLVAWASIYRGDELDDASCSKVIEVLTGRDEDVASDDPIFRAFPELTTLRRFRLARLELADAVLFLDVDPAVSMERIQARGESRQVHETEEKLTCLRNGYRLVCDSVDRDLGVPARTVDGHLPLDQVVDAALEALREMEVIAAGSLP